MGLHHFDGKTNNDWCDTSHELSHGFNHFQLSSDYSARRASVHVARTHSSEAMEELRDMDLGDRS